MRRFDRLLDHVGELIRRRVSAPPDPTTARVQSDIARLRRVLRPGDVVLVDGCDKVSAAIRFLTQSSWSHAAMFVGDR